MTRKAYTTDLSDLEWQVIEPLLPDPSGWAAKSNIAGGKSSTPFSISTEMVALGEICPVTSPRMVLFRTTIMLGGAMGSGN